MRTAPPRSIPSAPALARQSWAVSAYVDYHFNKHFDVYGGFMVSAALPVAYGGHNLPPAISYNNFAPTMGARFTF